MKAAISVKELTKSYKTSSVALNAISFEIQSGEMVALIGASGSGKSTLLRLISGLMPANSGTTSIIEVNDQSIQINGHIAADIRSSRAQIGLVFQQFNLVNRLTVLTNVLAGMLHRLPLYRTLFGIFKNEEKKLAYEALKRVGIAQCVHQRASTLSGGQQQRAAIARTMVQKAKVVLADEPIASLDPESSRMVMELLSEMNQKDGCTILVSLHQIQVAMKYCKRTIALSHGDIVYDGPTESLTPSLLRELFGVDAEELLREEQVNAEMSTPATTALHHPSHLANVY
jgi:phosphonate transport system ATP-binding protein